MADPLTVCTSVLAIVGATIKSSKIVFQIAGSIRGGPKEIEEIARDAQSLHSTLCSLHAGLQTERRTVNLVEGDTLLVMLDNLESPLSQCERILAELVVKMKKYSRADRRESDDRISVSSIKWSLFAKNEIKELQVRLEAARSNLNTTMNGFSGLCGLRLISTLNKLVGEIVNQPKSLQHACLQPRRQLEFTNSLAESSTNSISTATCGFPNFTSANDMTDTGREDASLGQGAHSSLITRRVSCSEDIPLEQGLTRIHRELADHKMLLRELLDEVTAKGKTGQNKVIDSVTEVPSGDNSDCESDSESNFDSTRSFTFFTPEEVSDDVSNCSIDDFYSTYGDLLRSLTPSPVGYLERSSFYYPESCTTGGLFTDVFFAIGRKRSEKCPWVQHFYILYAVTPRKWEHITASVDYQALPARAALFGADNPHDLDNRDISLPRYLTNEFSKLLSAIEQFSITRISLYLEQNQGGTIFANHAKSETAKFFEEADSFDQSHMIRDINDLDCEQILEGDLLTESRRSTSSFFVIAKSERVVERKAPFVSSGLTGINGMQNFFEDLKFLKSLKNQESIAQFKGVVLDDTRTLLRGYLMELPTLGSLVGMLVGARLKSESIPWSVRERWARQLVGAIADLHRIGSIFGKLWTANDIAIRGDGTLVLIDPRRSHTFFDCRIGMMAPELRGIPLNDLARLAQSFTFRTEIFCLGLHLWMIAEQMDNFNGIFCSRFACTSRPRYACKADHADPVELPCCGAGVPLYMNEIIRGCRAPDPKDRMTACRLLELFPLEKEKEKIEAISTHDLEILKRCAVSTTFGMPFSKYCSECGSRDMHVAYHCNQCDEANFDLCKTCFDQGITCFDLNHELYQISV